jgi:adenylosuccinate synthase
MVLWGDVKTSLFFLDKNMNTITCDLLYGDSGKGSIVNHLCDNNSLVIRYNGGFQAAHNVIHNGVHHTFSQFGSGTLKGCETFLLDNVIISPIGLINEAAALRGKEVTTPTNLITVCKDCLVTTAYHKALNRYRESINNHGSCGVGIGVTREMWSKTGNGLFFRDLYSYHGIRTKLNWVRQWCQDQLTYDKNFVNVFAGISFDEEVEKLRYAAQFIRSADYDELAYAARKREEQGDSIIFEGSQGAALDQTYGDIPHTTYSCTLPTHAIEFCQAARLGYEILGIIRAYETRHGNGPMSCEVPLAIKDDNIYDGAFAGKFRTGWLDLDKVRKFAKLCEVDCLAVNCLDQYDAFPIRKVIKGGVPTDMSTKTLLAELNQVCHVAIEGYSPEKKVNR